jgi:hypothetical protein
MTKFVTKTTFTVGMLLVLLSVPAFGASVNKSIKIDADTKSGGASSVNGSISVGENAVVTGGLRTVNGKIRIDTGASVKSAKTVNGSVLVSGNVTARDLQTVNGSIKVGAGSGVDGAIETVNGSITLEQGSEISQGIANINGKIKLENATVGGNVETVSGDVFLEDESVLKGDLILEEPSGWGWGKSNTRKPRIVIGPGSRVEGVIKLERKAELFISESAEVGGVEGVMSMDDATIFSGTRP